MSKPKRVAKFQLRLTCQEKQKASQLAKQEGISVSDLFRLALCEDLSVPDVEANVKIYLELGRIGEYLLKIDTALKAQEPFYSAKVLRTTRRLKEELYSLSESLTWIRQELKR